MGLEKIAEKLDKYYGRLESGKAAKIKPSHVEKAIAKLEAKQVELMQDLQDTDKASKKSRIESKLATVQKQIERAKWLLTQIEA